MSATADPLLTTQEYLLHRTRRWAVEPGADVDLNHLIALRSRLELYQFTIVAQEVEARFPDLIKNTALAAFAQVSRLPLSAIIPVLTHPVGVCWVRTARALLETAQISDLKSHLDGFAPLAVGCFARAGQNFSIRSASLPDTFSFPGLRLVVRHSRSDPFTIYTATDPDGTTIRIEWLNRTVSVALQGDTAGVVERDVEVVKLATLGSTQISFEHCEPVLRRLFPMVDLSSGPINVELWLARLAHSLNLLNRYWPEMCAELAASVKAVVPTSCGITASHSTGSDLTAWAAVNTALVQEPWLTDGLIHEHRHDLLNTLTLLADLFSDDAPLGDLLYSPWRPEPRPPIGVFHAVFVFVAVASFYLRLFVSDERDEQIDQELLRDAFALQVLNLRIGIAELKARVGFSSFGENLLAALEDETTRLQQEAIRTGAFNSGFAVRTASERYTAWCSMWGRHGAVDVPGVISRCINP